MFLRSRTRIMIAIFVIILLGLFVPPFINLNRYHGRIARSIESALGRHVTVGSVSPRLLPQPGFDLGSLTIGEDPAFGTEPMLHADEVRASLRLSSLWRGRLEIAKLSLKYPSLNLVRAADGRWNIEALLERASRIPTAPTAKARPESRTRFPYIEAENGRINFKIGQEKKVYALSDSDFALWLAAENELRTRLTARMVRTDSYLSDTGTVRFEGRFMRASNLRDTPLDVRVSLEGAQLGQLTKLVDGRDRGWRGTLDSEFVLGGTAGAMKVTARASLDDFRRYDIGSVEKVQFEARCQSEFSSTTESLTGIDCQMPMGEGTVTLKGSLNVSDSAGPYDLTLAARKIPAQAFVSLTRHAKKDIPADLNATGTIDAALTLQKTDSNAPATWSGGGAATNVVLQSAELKPELSLKEVQFGIPEPEVALAMKTHRRNTPRPPATHVEPRLAVTPFNIALGGSAPGKLSAWFSGTDYGVILQGDAQLARLLQLARVVGIGTPQMNAEGLASINVKLLGKWDGFEAPLTTGTAQLRGVMARMKGIASPLQLASANVELGPDSMNVSNVVATFEGSHLNMNGWVRMPRLCESVESCPITFELHADQVSTDELNRLFNPRAAKRPWYAILGSRPEACVLTRVQATGRIFAGRLAVKSLVANRVTAQLNLQSGQLVLSDLRADLWGGKHNGQWNADFATEPVKYSGRGSLDSVAMAQLATLMRDNWAAGAVNATYTISAAGLTLPEMVDSAKGDVQFTWHGGTLRHIVLNESSSPVTFRQFSGAIEFRNSTVKIAPESIMATSGGIYEVSGTASLGRQMDLTLRNGSHKYNVTGTLEKPKVTPAPQTEAQVSPKP